MGSLEVRRREVRESGEGNWVWPNETPTEKDMKELIGIALEIAVKLVFQNFIYTFGGNSFVQSFGGPIGARLTMCVSRLVMQDWHENFVLRLKESKLFEHLGGLYVDDGRNLLDILPLGCRFVSELGTIEFSKIWEKENMEKGITKKENTRREVEKLMNSINPDLRFTTEVEGEFETGRLPTLSFEMWCSEEGIRHSYYEKPMRSQILTMSRSSQSESSKYSILVNELSRRFIMMDRNIQIEEKIRIVDHFTQQLYNSGYKVPQIREIVTSSLKGIMRKEERKNRAENRYKSANETLEERMNKKLTEATSWYRERKGENSDEDTDVKREKVGRNSKMGNNEMRKRKRQKRESGEIVRKGEEGEKIYTVIFVQHTEYSEMAKRMRKKLDALENLGSIKVKLVERAGEKLVDSLHKSNAWSERDCERDDCMICRTEGSKKGSCRRRNILYETFCITCSKLMLENERKFEEIIREVNNEKEVEVGGEKEVGGEREKESEKENDEDRNRELISIETENKEEERENHLFKYIGESSRSGYERGVEHWDQFIRLDERSHILKHYLRYHRNTDKEELEIGMKVKATFKSAIERQVSEAVAIAREEGSGTSLMNSKAEYNRCKLPRLNTKVFEDQVKKMKQIKNLKEK